MNKRISHYVLFLTKLCLLALLVYYIYQHLKTQSYDDINNIFSRQILSISNLIYLIIAFCLVPLNWYFESLKFSSLFLASRKYSRKESLNIILVGVSFALITPLKIGEFAGRLVLTDKKDWKAALWANFLGNWCQWIALALFGIVGLQFMLNYIQKFSYNQLMLVNILLLLVIILLIYFLFKRHLWVALVLRFISGKYYNYFVNSESEIKLIDKTKILNACVFAALRYWVYTIQFALILKFFGSDISFFICICAVSTIYFFQLMLPFLSWMGLIGRTGIAIFVLHSIEVNEIISGIATLSLWVLNMVLPALVGIYLIFQFRLTKTIQNEKEINHL